MAFDIEALQLPVVQAPMAGGPSTPALAAAVSNAGGLGFLAAGYKTAAVMGEEISAARKLTGLPFGINLFVPQPSVAVAREIDRYRAELEVEAERYGVAVGAARDDDDGWTQKIDLLETVRPSVISFTFGLPSPDIVARLKSAGILLIATVTTLSEGRAADTAGMDVLCVQGPDGGGHRGTFDPSAHPSSRSLNNLMVLLRQETDRPLIAAGGLASRADVLRVRSMGAVAAQAGTAFLCSDEAGTKKAHRDAITSSAGAGTRVTRAFSGRYARGIINRFIEEHDASAPLGYPDVHHMTAPLRAAAAAAGDQDGLNLWAGVGYKSAQSLPADEIVWSLAP